MTGRQWEAFSGFRRDFRRQCLEWNAGFARLLEPLQRESCRKDTPEYPVETSVVYNRALDEVAADDEVRLIVVGDNPGKDEQRARNRRYLVGQAGKIAAGFFERNPELGIDFRRNALILNKTPIHTAKTAHLRHLLRFGPPEVRGLLRSSQRWMAERTAALHRSLSEGGGSPPCQLWLVGYAELKGRGLFLDYRDELASRYRAPVPSGGGMEAAWEQVMVYQHFSMNRFTIDLAASQEAGRVDVRLPLRERLDLLGALHRKEIFGV